MPMRMKVFNLSSYDRTAPFTIPINGAYWSLRVRNLTPASVLSMEGAPLCQLAAFNDLGGSEKGDVSIDFPPLFDAHGKPVPWNQILHFNGFGEAIEGAVIITYWDPAAPSEPQR